MTVRFQPCCPCCLYYPIDGGRARYGRAGEGSDHQLDYLRRLVYGRRPRLGWRPALAQIRRAVRRCVERWDDGNPTAGLELYPFAKSGAVCSTNLTPSIYDSLYEKQLPAFYASEQSGTVPSTVTPDNSLYTLWIGTNDVGAWGLLTGHEIGNATVVDTVQCAVNWVKTLYDCGARNFLWQNVSGEICNAEAKALMTFGDGTA